NSMTADDALFKTYSVGGTMAFGTTSTDANIHSHYTGSGAATSSYRYTGRMYVTDSGGGIGVTFYSDYPNSDTYYRLRRHGTGSSASFHLNSHGATVEPLNTHDTGVVPGVNTWYRFIVEVEDVSGETAIRAKVWEAGTTEPAAWQIDATDGSSRLTSGTFGLWAYNNGSKYWDDLAVASLTGAPANTPTPTSTSVVTATATATNMPVNTATPTATATPQPTTPPPDPVVIQRSTYSLGGQPIAVRVSGDPVAANNGIFYFHTDHLGSTSVMTSHSSGNIVFGSIARYTPFGDWRTEPSADLTDKGFTGHKSNNTGSNDLGLIYMNARWYVSGIGRFASADTIVPDPMNPQGLNRYSYVLNSPLTLIDPTGHIACNHESLPGEGPCNDDGSWRRPFRDQSLSNLTGSLVEDNTANFTPPEAHDALTSVYNYMYQTYYDQFCPGGRCFNDAFGGELQQLTLYYLAVERVENDLASTGLSPLGLLSSYLTVEAGSEAAALITLDSQLNSLGPSPAEESSKLLGPGTNITDKIQGQMSTRGWTQRRIQKVIDRPFHTSPALYKANGNPATAYFDARGAYVVRDNVTGDIIQISNRTIPWIPDSTITNPYIP
ncbi:MAG: hypothetical protein KC421_20725, partial [Anaerolineales bacterium]|nr:hypothetical protein [Anaerolineales bacterium]